MTKTNEPKREATIKSEVVRDEGLQAYGLRLMFSNGKQIELIDRDLSPTIIAEAVWHGIKQKLVDAAAISRNPDTGASATVDDKFRAVNDVFQRLLSGLWNEPREGGGNVGGLLLKALIRVYPAKAPDVLKAWLDGKTDAEKAALRKNPKVSAAILEIQAEQAKAEGIDSDAILDELDE